MAGTIDNLIAFRILNMLVTPFEDTLTYNLGVIDKNGNPLKKLKNMSQKERDNYTMLHRMVFRLKKIMAKIPLINNRLGDLAAAYWLVKECTENNRTTINLEEQYLDLLKTMKQQNIVLMDEEILIEKFFNEEVPTNATGVAVKTDEPVVRKRRDIKTLNRCAKDMTCGC
jgi:hypothetical protein